MLRELKCSDRQVFLEMSREFYASKAVCHNIPDDFHISMFEELISSDVYAECFIIEYDGEPAGYALLAKTFSREAGGLTFWIDEIYIRKEFRSRGLGSEVFDELLGRDEVMRFRLEVSPENERAIELYKKLGYEELDYLQFVKQVRT